MPDERVLKAILRFALDKQGLNATKQGAEDVEDALERVERQLMNVREAADALGSIGEVMAVTGAAMVAPFALAANSFVQYAGRADVVSRQWMDNQRRLEESQRRVGRVAAQAILPVMDTLADLAEDAAGFAEKHPDAIKAILGIGGTLAAVGAAATTVAKAAQMFATVKGGFIGLARLFGAGGAAGGGAAAAGGGAAAGGAAAAGGLSALGVAGSIFGGLLAGGAGYQAIATSKWGQSQGLANLQQYASVAAYGLGKLVGGTELANSWFVKVSGSLGAMDSATQAATEAALEAAKQRNDVGPERGPITEAAVDIYIGYRKAVERAERDYEESRTEMITGYARQRASMAENYERAMAQTTRQYRRDEQRALEQFQKSRGKMLERFHKDEVRAEEEYYRQRQEAASRRSVETQRAEEDHQRRIEQMRQAYELRQLDAVAERDAAAYLSNQLSYEQERQQAEQEHQVSMQRNDQDYAAQLQEMEDAYQRQREQRAEQLAEQLAEQQENYEEQTLLRAEQYREQIASMAASHREQMAELDASEAEQLSSMQLAHQRELAELEESLAEQLMALDENLLGERELRNQYYAQMTADLERWLDANARAFATQLNTPVRTSSAASTTPGWTSETSRYQQYRAVGGYASAGMYRLGEGGREFVMSNATTRMAERAAGGALTQGNVLSGGRHSLDLNMRLDAPNLNDANQAMLMSAFIPIAQEAAAGVFEQVMLRVRG